MLLSIRVPYSAIVTVAALVVATSAPAQQTWVVAQQLGPGVDFTDIPPAIAAAAPGDRIEVLGTTSLTPTYTSFVVDKSLDVEALDAALIRSIRVENLSAGEAVRISGFRCETIPTWQAPDDCVMVRDCDGTVLLCALDVNNRTGDYLHGLILRDARSVVLQDVVSLGRHGGIRRGGTALVVERSNCTVVRSTLTGGYGGSSISSASGENGGEGVVVSDGLLLAASCNIRGGPGSWGWAISGDGGTAVFHASAQASVVTLLDCSVTGGDEVVGLSSPGQVDHPRRCQLRLVDPLIAVRSERCPTAGAGDLGCSARQMR